MMKLCRISKQSQFNWMLVVMNVILENEEKLWIRQKPFKKHHNLLETLIIKCK